MAESNDSIAQYSVINETTGVTQGPLWSKQSALDMTRKIVTEAGHHWTVVLLPSQPLGVGSDIFTGIGPDAIPARWPEN